MIIIFPFVETSVPLQIGFKLKGAIATGNCKLEMRAPQGVRGASGKAESRIGRARGKKSRRGPTALPFLESKNPDTRRHAREVLEKIGGKENQKALRKQRESVGDKDGEKHDIDRTLEEIAKHSLSSQTIRKGQPDRISTGCSA